MSKLLDAAVAWADLTYPEIKSGAYAKQREKQRIAYMLGFERGYRIAARARLPAVEYMIDDDAETQKPSEVPILLRRQAD